MNPFLYPKSYHRRSQKPRIFTYYPSYKPYLRVEFGNQCVYCRLPDGPKGQDAFGVDHYRPVKLFPELVATYSNLYYACNCCNRRKGAFWPSSDQIRAGEFIPNPCDHVMFQHLRYQGVRVETKSPAGKCAEKHLMFNDEESLKYRELIIDLIAMAEEKRNDLEETIKRLEEQATIYPEQAELLGGEKQSTEIELRKIEQHLMRITGRS